mmetsp:Transcript_32170/g.90531  ORF Transcript_32170/g.90531 Transcript_32170/m.90531 type:complete len:122 (+) Transcript_32170:87-452(+)
MRVGATCNGCVLAQQLPDSAGDAWPPPQTTSFRRWDSRDSVDHEPMPGLRGALEDAGLASYIATAESWCADMGAAFLHELASEYEDFCAIFGNPRAGGPSVAQLRQLHSTIVTRSEGCVNL